MNPRVRPLLKHESPGSAQFCSQSVVLQWDSGPLPGLDLLSICIYVCNFVVIFIISDKFFKVFLFGLCTLYGPCTLM